MCSEPTGGLPDGAGLGSVDDVFEELPGLGTGRLSAPRQEWSHTLSGELAEVLASRQAQFEAFRIHQYVAWVQGLAEVSDACPTLAIPFGPYTISPAISCDAWALMRKLAVFAAVATVVAAILMRR